MNRGDADGRAGPQRPDSFGPFQALTALTDVQRLGLDAATEVGGLLRLWFLHGAAK